MLPIEVVYENGVFRPLQPVELPEGAIGEVVIASTPNGEADSGQTTETREGAQTLAAERAYQLLMEIAALPHNLPDDQTDIGPRHDDILYPKQGPTP